MNPNLLRKIKLIFLKNWHFLAKPYATLTKHFLAKPNANLAKDFSKLSSGC